MVMTTAVEGPQSLQKILLRMALPWKLIVQVLVSHFPINQPFNHLFTF